LNLSIYKQGIYGHKRTNDLVFSSLEMIKESIAISYAPLIIGTSIIFYKNFYSDPTTFQGYKAFEVAMWDIINDASQRPIIKLMANDFWDEYHSINTRLDRINTLIKKLVVRDPSGKILLSIPGIGPIIASAFVASIGKGQAFHTAKELGVWLGLTPKQFASGHRSVNGSITKRGNGYLRKQLIHGARTVVSHASKKQDDLNRWITQLRSRKSICSTVVATAHRLARLIWILLQKQVPYASQYAANHGTC
jgi:transposase